LVCFSGFLFFRARIPARNERDGRIDANGKRLLLAEKTLVQPPILADGTYQKIQPTAIAVLVAGFRTAPLYQPNERVRERHLVPLWNLNQARRVGI
jgi:hypothetical protein